MVLVQFFETDNIAKLQKMINEFLKSKALINVIDIKYNHHFDLNMGENNPWYTALVIYSGNIEFESDKS